MLGRQQIAGIPTAISELFKNAHDAYAERVEVDYYRRDGLFVLRDDGSGMEGTNSSTDGSRSQPRPASSESVPRAGFRSPRNAPGLSWGKKASVASPSRPSLPKCWCSLAPGVTARCPT